MQRFYAPTLLLSEDTTEFVVDKDSNDVIWHQVKNVLRSKPGDRMVFFNDTSVYEVEMSGVEKGKLSFIVINQVSSNSETKLQITLAQALPQKAEKWEWILQKGTELGVQQFIPLVTERTQRRGLPKEARMQRILIEAVEQSGRAKLPTIAGVQTLKELNFSENVILFASLKGTQTLLQHLKQLSSPHPITIVIGPEGGFSPAEEEYLLSQGGIAYSLGKGVLRLETAAIVSLGILSVYYA